MRLAADVGGEAIEEQHNAAFVGGREVRASQG